MFLILVDQDLLEHNVGIFIDRNSDHLPNLIGKQMLQDFFAQKGDNNYFIDREV